jgi:hypothetical protein
VAGFGCVPVENKGVLFLRSKLHTRPLVLMRVLLMNLWREPVGETHLSVLPATFLGQFFVRFHPWGKASEWKFATNLVTFEIPSLRKRGWLWHGVWYLLSSSYQLNRYKVPAGTKTPTP